MTRPKSAEVVVAYGQYHCSCCRSYLQFEPAQDIHTHEFAVGVCVVSSKCELRGVRLRVPLLRITCEVLPDA